MIDVDESYAAFKSRIYSVWPEVLPANSGGGIMEAEHHSMIAWDREILPFVALVMDPQRGMPLTMDSLFFRYTVEIYYVAFTKGGSSGLRQKMQALISDLWPDDIGAIQELDYGQIEDILSEQYNDSLFPNQFFRARNSFHRAGRLQVAYLVGTS